MITYLHRYAIPAAYDVLPVPMQSPAATAMLLAIALQESKAIHRRQVKGPARGFWQFEADGGVEGVLKHPATQRNARASLVALCYSKSMTVTDIHAALEHNDALAAVWARLLLWTEPAPLPPRELGMTEAWRQYLNTWRPGTPHPETWAENYDRAWAMVESQKGET